MTKLKGKKRLVAKREHKALEAKKKQADEIAGQIKKAKLVALVDVRALPDRLLQSARKGLRSNATFIIAKTAVLKRAIEKSGKAKELLPMLRVPTALVLADMSAYSLFRHFKTSRSPVAAKPGQVAPFDITVHEGETDLPPGPALSELKGAGINAQIKGGKIVVAKESVVAKTGTKITDAACKALQKLNVLPFTAGLTMVCGVEEGRMFSAEVLDIDEAKLASDLQAALGDAYNMSFNTSYFTEDNREALLKQALAHSRALATESGVYSETTMELLLASALRMGESLEGKINAAAPEAPAG